MRPALHRFVTDYFGDITDDQREALRAALLAERRSTIGHIIRQMGAGDELVEATKSAWGLPTGLEKE